MAAGCAAVNGRPAVNGFLAARHAQSLQALSVCQPRSENDGRCLQMTAGCGGDKLGCLLYQRMLTFILKCDCVCVHERSSTVNC